MAPRRNNHGGDHTRQEVDHLSDSFWTESGPNPLKNYVWVLGLAPCHVSRKWKKSAGTSGWSVPISPNSWVASLAVDSWVGHFPLQDKKLCSRSLTSVQILHTQILNFVLKYVLIYCHVEMPERSTDRYRFLEHGHNLWLLCFIFDYHHIYLYSFEIASHQKFLSLSLYIYIYTYTHTCPHCWWFFINLL